MSDERVSQRNRERTGHVADQDPEQFSEYVDEGKLPSTSKAEQRYGATEHVELPSVASGSAASARQMKWEQEELGDPEDD